MSYLDRNYKDKVFNDKALNSDLEGNNCSPTITLPNHKASDTVKKLITPRARGRALGDAVAYHTPE